MRHGREKGGVLGEINKMVVVREKVFKKGTSYLFQQTSIFGKNVLKEISYKERPIYGKKI